MKFNRIFSRLYLLYIYIYIYNVQFAQVTQEKLFVSECLHNQNRRHQFYQSADDSSDSPNIKIGCRDSCCNVINSVDTLTKSEENEKLIIQLINQIQNPELQKEYVEPVLELIEELDLHNLSILS